MDCPTIHSNDISRTLTHSDTVDNIAKVQLAPYIFHTADDFLHLLQLLIVLLSKSSAVLIPKTSKQQTTRRRVCNFRMKNLCERCQTRLEVRKACGNCQCCRRCNQWSQLWQSICYNVPQLRYDKNGDTKNGQKQATENVFLELQLHNDLINENKKCFLALKVDLLILNRKTVLQHKKLKELQ